MAGGAERFLAAPIDSIVRPFRPPDIPDTMQFVLYHKVTERLKLRMAQWDSGDIGARNHYLGAKTWMRLFAVSAMYSRWGVTLLSMARLFGC